MEFNDLLGDIHLMTWEEGHLYIPDNSIDLIYSDLPYNQTKNNWDQPIDLEKLWKDYKRIMKPNAAIILHCQGAFTSMLMQSNIKMWKYNLIWKKGNRISGHLNANIMPLRNHEDIAIFYSKLPTYNPQFTEGIPLHSMGHSYKTKPITNNNYGHVNTPNNSRAGTTQKYPISILDFPKPHPAIHPTQKPVELAEWLIATYSNPGDIVLDSTGGIGTSVKAAKNLKRIPISFEKTEKFYNLAKNFIN